MSLKLALKKSSSEKWLQEVLTNFSAFLIDHAANERKASSLAISLALHYRDRHELVTKMADLAVEELNHYRQVIKLMQSRNIVQTPDKKDPYIGQLQDHTKKGSDAFFLDRLLIAAVVEARGAERFGLLGAALTDPQLSGFYRSLAISEAKHHELFSELALTYFPEEQVSARLEEWLEIEATIIEGLPVSGRLH